VSVLPLWQTSEESATPSPLHAIGGRETVSFT